MLDPILEYFKRIHEWILLHWRGMQLICKGRKRVYKKEIRIELEIIVTENVVIRKNHQWLPSFLCEMLLGNMMLAQSPSITSTGYSIITQGKAAVLTFNMANDWTPCHHLTCIQLWKYNVKDPECGRVDGGPQKAHGKYILLKEPYLSFKFTLHKNRFNSTPSWTFWSMHTLCDNWSGLFQKVLVMES